MHWLKLQDKIDQMSLAKRPTEVGWSLTCGEFQAAGDDRADAAAEIVVSNIASSIVSRYSKAIGRPSEGFAITLLLDLCLLEPRHASFVKPRLNLNPHDGEQRIPVATGHLCGQREGDGFLPWTMSVCIGAAAGAGRDWTGTSGLSLARLQWIQEWPGCAQPRRESCGLPAENGKRESDRMKSERFARETGR